MRPLFAGHLRYKKGRIWGDSGVGICSFPFPGLRYPLDVPGFTAQWDTGSKMAGSAGFPCLTETGRTGPPTASLLTN